MVLEESFLKIDQFEPSNSSDNTIICIDEVNNCTDSGTSQEVDFNGNRDAVSSTIPSYCPAGKALLSMQDNLAKCSAAVFMIDDINALKEIDNKVITFTLSYCKLHLLT